MARRRGPSVRLKLTLSYAAFLVLAGTLLLVAVWMFLLRDVPLSVLVPSPANFLRIFDPSNFGPVIFGPAAIAVLAFLLVFGLAGGWFLAGRMLAPMRRITEATRTAASGSLSHRIALPGRSDEFRELADAFDAMLARLEAQVAEQQRFAANASHELRTPLAITRTLLDVARNDPHHDTGALIARLHAVNARAIDLTEALLLLSRADQRAFTRGSVDLSLVTEEAVETLLSLAEDRGVVIETSADTVFTFGSYPLLLQMTTNLLHNAIMHNLPGGSVSIAARNKADAALLTVENTGEMLSPSRLETFVEPFKRGVDRISSADAGVGLGLAIVNSIVQAHDGTLVLAPREGGGLRVTVCLPAARSPGSSAPKQPARPDRSGGRGEYLIGDTQRGV